jgi:hypothetical protein
VHGSEVASVTGGADNLKEQLPSRKGATKLRRQPFAPAAHAIKLLLNRGRLFETLLKAHCTAFRLDSPRRLPALLESVLRHTDHSELPEEEPKQILANPTVLEKLLGRDFTDNPGSECDRRLRKPSRRLSRPGFPRYGITSCLPVNRAQLHELLIIPENIPLAKGFAASSQIAFR